HGVVEDKRTGIFYELIKVVRPGNGHVAEVDAGIELWKVDIHPAGLGIGRAVGLHFSICRNIKRVRATRRKGDINFVGKFDAEITPGFGGVMLLAPPRTKGKEEA